MKDFINDILESTEWTKEELAKNVLLTVASAPIIYGIICLIFLAI